AGSLLELSGDIGQSHEQLAQGRLDVRRDLGTACPLADVVTEGARTSFEICDHGAESVYRFGCHWLVLFGSVFRRVSGITGRARLEALCPSGGGRVKQHGISQCGRLDRTLT